MRSSKLVGSRNGWWGCWWPVTVGLLALATAAWGCGPAERVGTYGPVEDGGEGGPEGDAAGEGSFLIDEDLGGDLQTPGAFAFVEVTATLHPFVGNAAIVHATTSRPARLNVRVEEARSGETQPVPAPDAFAVDHAVTALGMYANRTYNILVSATSEEGEIINAPPVQIATPPLPKDLPKLSVVVADSERMEPGYTLIGMTAAPTGQVPAKEPPHRIVALDSKGEVIWYLSKGAGPLIEFRPGLYAMLAPLGEGGICIMDLTGIQVGCFNSPLKVPLHHSLRRDSAGNLLALGAELRPFENLPPPYGPQKEDLVGDVLLHFAPDGSVLDSHSVFDLVSPYEYTSYSFFGDFWTMVFSPQSNHPRDWSHANNLAYDGADDSLVVTLLGPRLVVKTTRDGEVVWRLGPQGDVPLADGSFWFGDLHSAVPGPDGRLLLYDNRDGPGLPSRVLEYEVDTTPTDRKLWRTKVVWEYSALPPLHCPLLGYTEYLPGGNVLIADAMATVPGTRETHPVRVIEIQRSEPPLEVFRVEATSTVSGFATEISFAQRVKELYPPQK